MKKFLLALGLVIFIPGCGDKIDITETNFEYDVKVCDEYFELLDCIIKKDSNENYTPEIRDELRGEIKVMQEQWKDLNEKELSEKCDNEMKKFDSMYEELKKIGCMK